MSKVLKIIGVACAACSVLVLLGFVGSMRTSALCEKVLIENDAVYDKQLVKSEDVLAAIQAVENPVEGHPMNQIDTRSIEESVEALPYIKSATAYKTIDKKVVIELKERRLIARLIDQNGHSGFIDSEGYVLPRLSTVHLRLPVISGKFKLRKEALKQGYNSDADEILNAAFQYAQLIDQSEFWKAQLQQTYVDEDGNFIAIPQVGNHEILFGNISGIEKKLENLATFYEKGMNDSRWNKYKSINLKYEDQVVCTKK